jgi:hypothetical protein
MPTKQMPGSLEGKAMKQFRSTLYATILMVVLTTTAFAGDIGSPRAARTGDIGSPKAAAVGDIGSPKLSAPASGDIGSPKTDLAIYVILLVSSMVW